MEVVLVKFLKLNIKISEVLAQVREAPDANIRPRKPDSHVIDLKDISPIKETNFVNLLQGIVGWLIAVAIPIAALMILIGGYQIMFAGGNPEKVNTGKRTILYAVVGFSIIALAWGFITIIQQLLGLKK